MPNNVPDRGVVPGGAGRPCSHPEGTVQEPTPTTRMMVVSVGGSAEPILFSLNRQQPDFVVYFCSEESRGVVATQIRPGLTVTPRDDEVLTTPSAESLVPAYQCARDGVRRCMRLWGVPGPDVVVDYTGGTKNMSAALALATVDLGCRYSYVGGAERTKDGLGVVIGGQEKMFYPSNPWEVLGVERLRAAALLFNRARYGPAQERLTQVAERVSGPWQRVYRHLAKVVEGFGYWDRFDHDGARRALDQGLGKLRESVGLLEDSATRTFIEQALAVHARLPEIRPSSPAQYVADLIANAARRADLEEKYEDAVARLYAAIEKLGKLILKQDHGLDNSRLAPDDVPDPLRDDYRARYWSVEKGCLQVPLHATYDLLAALGDSLGRRVVDGWQTIGPLLDQRNQSILGHGTQTVSRQTYERLRDTALALLEMGEGDLPNFPTWTEG